MKDIYVLRLGHRPARDKRVTTHVILVARAFGAKGVYIEGKDEKMIKSISKVIDSWGGSSYFLVKEIENGKNIVNEWKEKGGTVIHLTMYGININDLQDKLDKIKYPLLIIAGAEKVEGWYYRNVDYNIAIGNQPHSEVAALAIFLDRIYKGRELYMEFGDAKIKILPQNVGKKVIRNG
ncbi:tRNA methyltransferase [Sulfolobus islandicus]|uniref:tRNA (cytidine(56)-2'-O)-methyltransferase n=2 Tax=Saccharolobus islandicus TaxID=43080 RepID=F0NIK6_SACI5|nr:tRNA methyltransferase [Sulfolobus islandicus]ADX83157.1 conserved hypothetical protein [Sulfolobus islandicus HVE10/4]ADX85793.1 conserved hypothetical protein [Sulfolobus islandicus REY15A]WCM38071.1 tRNA methyltransferase [Sulfolobus islandicus]